VKHDARDVLIDVRIDRLAPGGDAVGRQVGGADDGRATFVALAAPGERVHARITRRKARVAWAELLLVRQPSPSRVPAPCPLFGRCGGCQWQHVDLVAQRTAKREIVARALGRPDVSMIAPTADGTGYRDRAQLVVGSQGEIGFRARRSHAVVDVDRCLLFAPALDAALRAIRSSPAFPVDTEIDMQAGHEGVHVAVLPPSSSRSGDLDGAAMLAAWGPSGVVGVRIGGTGKAQLFGAADVDIAGPGEPALRIPGGSFAQVGGAANVALVRQVLDSIGDNPGTMWELYAGSGNFTRHVVRRAIHVVACDADAAAVARGARNVPEATWATRPPTDTAGDADTVLVDPPRAGLDGENLVAAIRARRRIVYVSCDPQTLGRDAAKLAAAGFVLRHAVALDLMPHTFHVEVVAAFDRA
jgi:23S rRNA (uracil1939-C5)-methyltransferase